ncbi:MAG TPA: hypothetical protein VHQ64_02500 [Pyrinomonadaceae bacterium]|nr:hypothetical protein [Pyrinomonadaceae bacterium]
MEGLDRDSRQEILEMLEPLVTTSGTRNIIERERLISAPFRDSQKRKELLDLLVNHTIVRTEPRLGGFFVEITHEFLIAPVLEALTDVVSKDPEYNRYRQSMRALERLHGSSIAGASPQLTQQDFFTLHRHLEVVCWDNWSSELMLRCAVAFGVSRDVLETWLKMFARFQTEVEPQPAYNLVKNTVDETECLSLAQLRFLNDHRDLTQKLIDEQIEIIWRSELTWAVDEERDEIKYWTGRMKNRG